MARQVKVITAAEAAALQKIIVQPHKLLRLHIV